MIVLKAQSPTNVPLEATFDPDHGMRLMSFRKGKIEVIAGESGPIGPHFGLLHPGINPHAYVDGIARYAPWKATSTENTIRAQLSGKEEWNGKAISSLEGQAFKMEIIASLTPEKLAIQISVVADADALVGYGCHFKLAKGAGHVISDVQDHFLEKTGAKPVPTEWGYDHQRRLRVNLDRPIDAIFHPFPNPLMTSIRLEAGAYQLDLRYRCQNAENAWQLKRSAAGSSVYLASLGAKSPFRPVLTVNSILMELSIFS